MTVDALLAPDVYVNASVAGVGLPPERVASRFLGEHRGKTRSTPWVLKRVAEMLTAHPDFKTDSVRPQIQAIRDALELVDDGSDGKFGADSWEPALVAAAKAAGVSRVITDHPDLIDRGTVDGVDFVSCDSWLLEESTPPPPPGS
jgi:hypothetical protein